tara:strand:- start:104 stop:622 length:519 start_codon:yes stop_codon:yes gene_type:complete
MASIWDTPEGKLGKEGENWVLKWRRDAGIYVMPATDYSGTDGTHAPMIRTWREKIVLPDFYCAKGGVSWWDEAKSKSEPLKWRMHGGKLYHGIEKRQLGHYLRVNEITGLPVGLVVYEQCSGTYLYLKNFLHIEPVVLGNGRIKGGASDGAEMVNYARSDFKEIAHAPSKTN